MGETTILQSKNLDLFYGDHQALKGISMDIPEKQITALIGPSGCGKSTFMKTINRMNDLVPGVTIKGQMLYRDQDIYAPEVDVTWLRKRIGMVFQKPNPFPMSIYDNVAYGPRTHGIKNRKQLDDAESLLQVLRKQLAAQNSSLQNSDRSLSWQSSSVDIQVAQVDDQLAKCRVCAPVAGTVLAQYAESGEFVAPGTPLFRLGDMERMYLRAYVTGEQLAEVRLGQTVTVVADYGGGQQREYEGQVTWISDTSEFTPKNILTRDERANLVYAVKVAVRNDGGLKIGMYGGLRF